MGLRSLLETPVRKIAIATALVGALAGCGGGDGCKNPTDPSCNPQKTAAVTSFSITPYMQPGQTAPLYGDTADIRATATSSDGGLSGIAITNPDGTPLANGSGASLDVLRVPTQSGTYTAAPVEAGATLTNRTANLTLTPLTVSPALDRSSMYVTDSAKLTLTAPAGTDSVTADWPSHHLVATGNNAATYIKATAPGIITITSHAYNNAASATGAPQTLTVTPPPAPTATAVDLSYNEADSASSDLSTKTTGLANRTYRVINVPSDLQAIVQGSTLKVKDVDNNFNGSRQFLYIVQDANGADTAQVGVTVNPMTDINYNLVEQRTGNLITQPTWVYIDNDSMLVTGGNFTKKLTLGPHNIGLLRNPDLFQFSIVTQPDGTKGYNWPSPVPATAFTTFNFGPDFTTPGTITALNDVPPADTLATFNRATYPAYTQAFPTIPVPIIPMTIYVQKKASSVVGSDGPMCNDADSTFLQILVQGADSAVRVYQRPAYSLNVVVGDSVPSMTVNINGQQAIRPAKGYELVCQKNTFNGLPGAFGGVFPDVNTGEIISGIAQVSPGYPLTIVFGEIARIHAGERFDGPDTSSVTFYTRQLHPGEALTPSDLDLYNVVDMFARPAMVKFLQVGQNNQNAYPKIMPY